MKIMIEFFYYSCGMFTLHTHKLTSYIVVEKYVLEAMNKFTMDSLCIVLHTFGEQFPNILIID